MFEKSKDQRNSLFIIHHLMFLKIVFFRILFQNIENKVGIQTDQNKKLEFRKEIVLYNQHGGLTLGSEAKYVSGVSISARTEPLMAIAAFWICFAQSRLCRKCFLDFSDRPPEGTHGTGSHHFSS